MRDSAHLAGHQDDAFNVAQFQGTQSVLVGPGRTGVNVPTFGMRRLQDLGLFRIIGERERGLKFDLVDDVRDRLEEMRFAAGQPSRMGELQASVERAEAATESAEAARHDLENKITAAARARADLRAAFARRVGRRLRRGVTIGLVAVYVAVIVIAGYFVSSLPLPLVVGIVGVSVALAVLAWVRRIDGFSLAAGVESWVVKRLIRWLEFFDQDP
jgi:hypothetical protein